MREVRQVEQRLGALMLGRVELNAELLDLRGAGSVRLLNVGRVFALTFRAGDLVA